MKHAFLALFLFSGIAIAADDKENDKLLQSIAGSYSVSAFERGGQPAEPEFIKKLQAVTIKGNKLTITFKEEAKSEDKSATISLDASKKPVAIDLKELDGPKKNEVSQGVIDIADDVVKICWSEGPNAKRPAEATSTKENKNFLLTLKRVKE